MPSHRCSLHPCELLIPSVPVSISLFLSPPLHINTRTHSFSLSLSVSPSLTTLADSSLPFSCPAFNGDLCISLCSPNRATCVRPPRVLTLLSGLK